MYIWIESKKVVNFRLVFTYNYGIEDTKDINSEKIAGATLVVTGGLEVRNSLLAAIKISLTSPSS
jgi:hypothetical protein